MRSVGEARQRQVEIDVVTGRVRSMVVEVVCIIISIENTSVSSAIKARRVKKRCEYDVSAAPGRRWIRLG